MNQLEAIGGIAPRAPIGADIEFEGNIQRFFFVQHGYADMLAKMGDVVVPEGKRKELVILTSTLRLGEDGADVPTYEQLAAVKPGLIKKLIEKAYEVNSPEENSKN
jgi:hypothetical protein